MEEILDSLSRELRESGKHKDCYNEYASLKTDEERVKFTMRILCEYKKIMKIPKASCSSKSTTEAIKYRDKGNCFFVNPMSSGKPELNNSIKMYTKSVAHAPMNSKELALAFANRSASLFRARLYKDCILDIERALKLPYPDNLKAKLFARKAKCLMALRITSKVQKIEIEETLDNTRKWLMKMEKDNQARKIIEIFLNHPEKISTTVEKEFIKWNPQLHLPSIPKDNNNREIPNVSSALKIKYTEKFGKHVVATRNIEPGEVLAVMKPYACVLVPEKFYTHCSYCTEQTWSSLPCEKCVNVIYCSEECRESAWNDHHSIECQVIGPLVAMEMSNLGLLSMRLVVRAIKESGGSIENLKKKTLMIDTLKDLRTNGFTNGILDDRDYASVYTLAKNTEKRSIPDLFGRSLNATYIVFMLATCSDLFGNFSLTFDLQSLEKNQWITFVGGLIMRHQQIIPSNVHSLTEEDIVPVPIERAAALMPFYSLINHSCNPSVTRISHGKQIILYADYAISMGEQIFDNYGIHYALTPKSHRQSKLMQQFRFICECDACTKNWPTYLDIPSFLNQVTISSHDQQIIRHATRNFNKYYELANFEVIDEKTSLIISDLNEMTRILQKIVDLPCKEFNDIIETKKRILSLLGNRFQSLD